MPSRRSASGDAVIVGWPGLKLGSSRNSPSRTESILKKASSPRDVAPLAAAALPSAKLVFPVEAGGVVPRRARLPAVPEVLDHAGGPHLAGRPGAAGGTARAARRSMS